MFARTGRLDDVVIVALPTIGRHIRERGFDHMEKLGRRLARLSGGCYVELLGREKNTTQVGASMERRKAQAKEAFCLRRKIEPGSRILLLDDVWTTGSSMIAASELLKKNGYQNIMVALLARSG